MTRSCSICLVRRRKSRLTRRISSLFSAQTLDLLKDSETLSREIDGLLREGEVPLELLDRAIALAEDALMPPPRHDPTPDESDDRGREDADRAGTGQPLEERVRTDRGDERPPRVFRLATR